MGRSAARFFHNLPFFFTYTNNWFVDKDAGEHVTFAFAWSLATEEQFYLFWPSIVRFAKKWWTPLAIILGAAGVDIMMEILTGHGIDRPGRQWQSHPHQHRDADLRGMRLAYLLHMPRGFAFARPVLANRLAAPIALIALLIAYLFINESLMILFMVILVGAVCIRADNGLSWILANPVARYIGTISYGLYLLHMIAMNGTKVLHKDHDWIFFAIALALSIGMASASYWMYEVPFLRLKNRFRKADQPKALDHAESSGRNTATPMVPDPIRV